MRDSLTLMLPHLKMSVKGIRHLMSYWETDVVKYRVSASAFTDSIPSYFFLEKREVVDLYHSFKNAQRLLSELDSIPYGWYHLIRDMNTEIDYLMELQQSGNQWLTPEERKKALKLIRRAKIFAKIPLKYQRMLWISWYGEYARKGSVYIAEVNGEYKIGRSTNVEQRMKQLKGNLLYSFATDDMGHDESYCHYLAKSYQLHGEYFIPCDEVVRIVKEYMEQRPAWNGETAEEILQLAGIQSRITQP